MELFKRELSPLTAQAWAEIDNVAKDVLVSNLSARHFVDVDGPKGWDFASVNLGRLDIPKGQDDKSVRYGVHAVQPLVETRLSFDLNVMELDNLDRGAKDVDLDALEDAAKKMAQFEEDTIYNGFEAGGIKGLLQSVELPALKYKAKDPATFLEALLKGVTQFKKDGIEGPYALVVNPEVYGTLVKETKGFPFAKQVEGLIDGGVVDSFRVKDALLVSTRGGDFELTIGQDMGIGYQGQAGLDVTLFMAESFTFRVIEPRAIQVFEGK